MLLWAGFYAGPVAWLLHLTLSFMLVPTARWIDSKALLHAISALTLLITAAGAVLCWRRSRVDSAAASDSTRTNVVIARAGVLIDAFFFVVIIAEDLPNWILRLGDT
jgi:hypothetical protein